MFPNTQEMEVKHEFKKYKNERLVRRKLTFACMCDIASVYTFYQHTRFVESKTHTLVSPTSRVVIDHAANVDARAKV